MALLLGAWGVLLGMAIVLAVHGLSSLSSAEHDSRDVAKSAGADGKEVGTVTGRLSESQPPNTRVQRARSVSGRFSAK